MWICGIDDRASPSIHPHSVALSFFVGRLYGEVTSWCGEADRREARKVDCLRGDHVRSWALMSDQAETTFNAQSESLGVASAPSKSWREVSILARAARSIMPTHEFLE